VEVRGNFVVFFQYEDLRRKLDDFERINKAQRTLNDHNQTLENELKKLKLK
jgi:chaperonin cofactor prefoldin